MIFKVLRALIFFIFLVFPSFCLKSQGDLFEIIEAPQFDVSSSFLKNEPIRCQSLCLNPDSFLLRVGYIIQQDLNFTDQVVVDLKKYHSEPTLEVMNRFFKKGISIFLLLEKDGGRVKLFLKDSRSGELLYEENFDIGTKGAVWLGHEIAKKLLLNLSGDEGPFLSTIAYCKMEGPYHKDIYVTDLLFQSERKVVASPTLNVAPCWHSSLPLLFFSQFTKRNSRLMSVDVTTGKKRIVCSYDGLNMQPSFSKDGTKAVLCLSAGGNSELYLYDKNIPKKNGKTIFKRLTKNGGNNVSPILLPNDDIVFCSDFQTGAPQIFYLSQRKHKIYRLTNGRGYCAAPSYCEKRNSIVYTRLVNGVFQLFSIDLKKVGKEKNYERQLTFDSGDKHEPSFSSCGRYVIFSYSKRSDFVLKMPQIAILNVDSGRIRVLTKSNQPKSYPAWVDRKYW